MVTAESRPEKEGYVLVQFFYGANLATQARYTDWDQPILGYTSEPRMALSIPENEGTFDRRELRIILPIDDFTGTAVSGSPHSPIFVIVEEATQGLFSGDQNSQKVLYRGRVVRTIKNFQGRANSAAFFCLPQKSRLDVTLGLPCNHHCAWTLFKGGCGASQISFQELTEIDSVDGNEVTITDLAITVPGGSDATYWKRGYLSKDGLRIHIRDYDGSVDPSKLYTSRKVPDSWVGGTNDVLAVPGCTKSIEVCRSRYNQEETFLGLGYKIPPYQPNIESPE